MGYISIILKLNLFKSLTILFAEHDYYCPHNPQITKFTVWLTLLLFQK